MNVWILKIFHNSALESTVIQGVYDSIDAILAFFQHRRYTVTVEVASSYELLIGVANTTGQYKYYAHRAFVSTVTSVKEE